MPSPEYTALRSEILSLSYKCVQDATRVKEIMRDASDRKLAILQPLAQFAIEYSDPVFLPTLRRLRTESDKIERGEFGEVTLAEKNSLLEWKSILIDDVRKVTQLRDLIIFLGAKGDMEKISQMAASK